MGSADPDFEVREGAAQSDVKLWGGGGGGWGWRLYLELEIGRSASWTPPLAGSKQALKG